jgi:hypothetical protein
MTEHPRRVWSWLAAVVALHLIVSIVHGTAHSAAHVPLSRAATLFVYVVILAGPIVGLAIAWSFARAGGWTVAVTLAASLVFGVLNHFVIAGSDYVAHVDLAWRPLFTTTAVLLALSEAAGAVLGVRLALERTRP